MIFDCCVKASSSISRFSVLIFSDYTDRVSIVVLQRNNLKPIIILFVFYAFLVVSDKVVNNLTTKLLILHH